MQTNLNLSVILLLAITLLAAAPSENEVDNDHYIYGKDGPVCITPGCVKAAATILENLDQTVDPCDDFFQFACGGFIKQHVIPEEKSSINYFNIIDDKIQEQLRLILEEPTKPDELRPFALAKNFYSVCMNTTRIEHDGLQTIKAVLKQLGGWPVLEGATWDGHNFDWKNFIYDSRKIGLTTSRLLTVYVGTNMFNSSTRIISMDQASLYLEREYLVKGFGDVVVKAYYDYLVDLALKFGASKDHASTDIRQALEFEIKLAEITLPKEERRNITALTNIMTIQELQTRYPSIPWQDYLSNLLAVAGYSAQPNDMIDVASLKYVQQLIDLLQATPKRTLANYLLSHVVISAIPSLTKELKDRELQLNKVYYGMEARQARWKECTRSAASKLRLAVDALYVRKYVGDNVKRNAEELINNLKSTFTNMLQHVEWMDENTKKEALAKAAVMQARIAYAPELRDNSKLEEFYSKLEPADTLLEFNFNMKKFAEDTSFRKLPEIVSKTDWTEHSYVCSVDAYYNMVENSIQLPAGILQDVFFDVDRPNYLNYGSIGFAIGHEITHGFDDEGKQHDKDGNVREWWAVETSKAFTNKAQCIIDQYSNYTVPEINLNLNGVNTQGENVADNGGVKEAYLAYTSWVNRHGEEPRLPGLNYTQKQLFWISTANLWCQNQRTEFLRQNVLTNVHCPPKYRVIVPLSNSEEFSEDYKCPIGSKMNPERKCHVW